LEAIMALKRIRLELARTKEFPEGSSRIHYDFVAPLDAAGHFDATEWKKFQDVCTVHRVWEGEGDERGVLLHTSGRRWVFSYEPGDDTDDEPIFKFDRHAFKEGEYVSITEHDGKTRPFKVVSVQPHIVAGGAAKPRVAS
jgi:hypothetical protein